MSSVYRARARHSLVGVFENPWLMGVVAYFLISAVISVVSLATGSIGAWLVVGPMSYGFAYMLLKRLRSGEQIEISEAFSGFTNDFVRNMITGLLVSLFTFLWSLLFIIPGIVKAYSYSMTYYVSLDHPEYSSTQCIEESQRLMDGHKWELFCLDLSFIGWYILGSMLFGVGTLWVYVYNEQARAHFYQDLVTAQVSGAPFVE